MYIWLQSMQEIIIVVTLLMRRTFHTKCPCWKERKDVRKLKRFFKNHHFFKQKPTGISFGVFFICVIKSNGILLIVDETVIEIMNVKSLKIFLLSFI